MVERMSLSRKLSFLLSSLGSRNRLLGMMLQDGKLLKFPHNTVKCPTHKDIVVRSKETDSS